MKLLYPRGFSWRSRRLDPHHYFEHIPLVNDLAGIIEGELVSGRRDIILGHQILVPADNRDLNLMSDPTAGEMFVSTKFGN